MASVDIRDPGKRCGAIAVLHPTSVRVADGGFVAVVGPSGCGKPTLPRVIAGLAEASGGSVAIGGGRRSGRPAGLPARPLLLRRRGCGARDDSDCASPPRRYAARRRGILAWHRADMPSPRTA
ncbi:MAG: hypothetical protein DI544_06975 [Sphingomonas taxi]|uniref:ABC transporter domain-containing protein n=1 Tax=Sphingomonas taxi TaxID=1549858 RepID=A0A2W5P844_9SPHN|nr:MAG: hypothetical protein DI544_06975 [Sphingomonas taxi]